MAEKGGVERGKSSNQASRQQATGGKDYVSQESFGHSRSGTRPVSWRALPEASPTARSGEPCPAGHSLVFSR